MTPDPKHKAIRLNSTQLSKVKRDLYFNRAYGRCETCHQPISFGRSYFSHIKSRGAGGDDSAENGKIECIHCHMVVKHGPQWGRRKP